MTEQEKIQKAREVSAKWRAENPDKVRAAQAKWRAENPEKAKANNAKWRAENIEKKKEGIKIKIPAKYPGRSYIDYAKLKAKQAATEAKKTQL